MDTILMTNDDQLLNSLKKGSLPSLSLLAAPPFRAMMRHAESQLGVWGAL